MTAAIGAINAQLRADEQRLRRKVLGDVLGRLLKIVEEERKKLPARTSSEVPLAEVQQGEHVELEQSEAPQDFGDLYVGQITTTSGWDRTDGLGHIDDGAALVERQCLDVAFENLGRCHVSLRFREGLRGGARRQHGSAVDPTERVLIPISPRRR